MMPANGAERHFSREKIGVGATFTGIADITSDA